MKPRQRSGVVTFSGYAILYDVKSAPHPHDGLRDRVAPGAFARSLRPVPLVVDHDDTRVVADQVILKADRKGIHFTCRTSALPSRILGLSIAFRKARWRRDGRTWLLVDGEIVHVSIASAQPPHFPATLATCKQQVIQATRQSNRSHTSPARAGGTARRKRA
jgi:phage head maturation protease